MYICMYVCMYVCNIYVLLYVFICIKYMYLHIYLHKYFHIFLHIYCHIFLDIYLSTFAVVVLPYVEFNIESGFCIIAPQQPIILLEFISSYFYLPIMFIFWNELLVRNPLILHTQLGSK